MGRDARPPREVPATVVPRLGRVNTGPRAVDELRATVAPTAAALQRRVPEIVAGFAVLCTVLVGLALIGSAVDDAAIDSDLAEAEAEVLEGSTFLRTLVRFTLPDGQAVVPDRGVLHPRGLSVGDRVVVEYSTEQPELVRVAGRGTLPGSWPLLVGLVVVWAVCAPLTVWLRRRRRG